jgi:hypothetical protein
MKLALFGAIDDTATAQSVPAEGRLCLRPGKLPDPTQIGFDWLCFFARSSFLAQKRMKLALFGAIDDTVTARNGDWYVPRSGLYLSPFSRRRFRIEYWAFGMGYLACRARSHLVIERSMEIVYQWVLYVKQNPGRHRNPSSSRSGRPSPAQRSNLREKTQRGAERRYGPRRGARRGCRTTNMIGMTKEA